MLPLLRIIKKSENLMMRQNEVYFPISDFLKKVFFKLCQIEDF